MNKLEQLIQQYCPEGVEYRELGEVLISLKTGLNPRKNFTLNTPNAKNYYVTVRELNGIGITFFDKTDKVNNEGLRLINNRSNLGIGDVLYSGTGTIGKTAIVKENPINWNVKEGIYVIKPNQENIISMFLLYYLNSSLAINQIENKVVGSPVCSIPMAELKKIKIPTPPLTIQQEIVYILDKFTQLEAELEAELEARRAQYEYYRNELLSAKEVNGKWLINGIEVEWKTLGEVCDMKAGKSISANNITDNITETNYYPCLGGNNLRGYVKSFSHEGEFPIIGRQGALCGNICYAKGKFYATEHAVVVRHKGLFISRFLYFMLLDMNLNQFATGGAQPGLAVSKIEKINIPIPPLSEQERIVSILDKFDSLVNDISVGLPAEIAARRKQYEYYRNRLLTFTPLTSNH